MTKRAEPEPLVRITEEEAIGIAMREWEAGLEREAVAQRARIRTGGLGPEAVARIDAASGGRLLGGYLPEPPRAIRTHTGWQILIGETPAPWVDVDGCTGEVTGRGVPPFEPINLFPRLKRLGARRLALMRRLRRLPPLRVGHDEAVEAALIAYERDRNKYLTTLDGRCDIEKRYVPEAFAYERLRGWLVYPKFGYSSGLSVWVDGQTGEATLSCRSSQ